MTAEQLMDALCKRDAERERQAFDATVDAYLEKAQQFYEKITRSGTGYGDFDHENLVKIMCSMMITAELSKFNQNMMQLEMTLRGNQS